MRTSAFLIACVLAPGCTLLFDGSKHLHPSDDDAGHVDAGMPGDDAGHRDTGTCALAESQCSDGVDEDCDGPTDCEDSDCADFCACGDLNQDCCGGVDCNAPFVCGGDYICHDAVTCAADPDACPFGTYCAGDVCQSCDTNGDGLDDSPDCPGTRHSLRFFNLNDTDVTVRLAGSGATIANLFANGGYLNVPNVLDGAYTFEFSGTAGSLTFTVDHVGAATTIVYYFSEATLDPEVSSLSQPDPLGCSGDSYIAFGQFTTVDPTPATVFESLDNGATWTRTLDPGLLQGQFVVYGCWAASLPRIVGLGPPGSIEPTVAYEMFPLFSGQSFQLIMYNDGMIVVDDLDSAVSWARVR